MFDHHSSPALFFFFFFEVEISLCALIPLSMPGSVHSGSASWDDCGWMFLDKLSVSSFPDRFPHPGQLHVSLLWLSWVKGVCMPPALLAESRVYACHLHFWQNDQGLLHASVVTQGWNRHWIRISIQSWLWKKSNCPTAPAGIWTHNLSITSPALCKRPLLFFSMRRGHSMDHPFSVTTLAGFVGWSLKRALTVWMKSFRYYNKFCLQILPSFPKECFQIFCRSITASIKNNLGRQLLRPFILPCFSTVVVCIPFWFLVC